MKKTILVFLFSIFSFSGFCQSTIIQDFLFNTGQTIDCKWDTNVSVQGYNEWCVYQTLDSTMFGPVDSNSCFNSANTTSGNLDIDFDDVDLTKPLYIRYVFDSTNQIILDSNGLFKIYADVDGSVFPFGGAPLVDTTANCKDGLCTGIFVGMQTPINTGSGTVISWYNGGYTESPWPANKSLTVCMPTQRFLNNNILKELIIRIQPNLSLAGENLEISKVTIEESNNVIPFNSINAYTSTGPSDWTSYMTWSDYLGMYHDTTFPSVANISYLDVLPSPNLATINTVNINVNLGGSINFQPYTQLRGGLILGSTTDRHIYNVNIFNGNICITNFVELIFFGNDRFTYTGGNLDFYGPRACLMFGNGGTLTISDNTIFHYGKSQQGLLALLQGSTIEIGKNSTLKISNTVILDDHPDVFDDPQIFLTLNKGSKLQFLNGAHIENKSSNSAMKLNIYMEGGEIDLSGLPKDELTLVNLIYRKAFDDEEKNLLIVQNPVIDKLNLEYISASNKEITLEVFDIRGNKIVANRFEVNKGINFINVSTSIFSKGIYLLKLTQGHSVTNKKFTKL